MEGALLCRKARGVGRHRTSGADFSDGPLGRIGAFLFHFQTAFPIGAACEWVVLE